LTPISVGINAAAWDSHLTDASIPALLANANLGVIRYPGGSTADNYHWLSNTSDDPAQGGTVASANFDAYMAVVAAAGAQSMITVNYGSGSPEEAAGWVAYANRGGPKYRGALPTYPGANSTGHRYHMPRRNLGTIQFCQLPVIPSTSSTFTGTRRVQPASPTRPFWLRHKVVSVRVSATRRVSGLWSQR